MTLKLVVMTNVDGDVFELVLKNARYGVGRRHDNDLRIKETYISGYHAELVRDEDGGYLLADLGSSNGTFLNGRRIGGKEVVKAGDFIKFGILKVAVQELTDATPKIVALKDRPAFARKAGLQTAAIAVERKTGSIATVEPGRGAGETRATLTEAQGTKEVAVEVALMAELKARLDRESKVIAELNRELESRKGQISSLDSEVAKLRESEAAIAKEVTGKGVIEEELATRSRELADSKTAAEELMEKLKQAETESGNTSLLLKARTGEADRLEKELATARDTLARSGQDSRKAHAKLTADLEVLSAELTEKAGEVTAKEKSVSNLLTERDSLKAALEAKEGDLAASVGEVAKLAVMAASLASLQDQLGETRAIAETEQANRVCLEESMKERDAEIASQSKGLGSLRSEIATLESKQARQSEDLAAAKSTLQEKEAEMRIVAAEAKKVKKLSKDLEALGADRVSTRSALEAALAKEAALNVAARENESRLSSLENELREAEAKGGKLAETLADRIAEAEAGRIEADRIAAEFENFRSESAEIFAAKEAALASETSRLLSQVAERVAEVEDLRSRASLQTGDIQAAKAEANDLRMELRKARESSENALNDLEATLRSRVAGLETALSGERVRSTDAATEKNQLKEALGVLQTELATLREESGQLRVRHEDTSRSNGRLQAELNREAAERTQMADSLESSRTRVNELVSEMEVMKLSLEGKDREIAEQEQQFVRSESEVVQKLKRELSEAVFVRDTAEEKATKALKEKQTLGGAFERLKEQLDQTENSLREARTAEEELNHGKGLLARRVEKAEASSNELAVRIKEESMAALASRTLVEKLELQIRENESEAVQREREQVHALKADLSRASRRTAEDERRRRDLEVEFSRIDEARKQAEERILGLEARLLEQETETVSTRGLLNDTEKSRVDLTSRLASEAALVVSHVRTIGGLRTELADTISRSTTTETSLIARHGDETDALLSELRGERTVRDGLEVELKNTREGLSEALHRAREESAKAQAKLLAEGNANLSSVEEELSAAIRSREVVEESRSHLEDELNQRDEEIEGLSQRIEDFEIRLRDEIEAGQGVSRRLETTRAGFSESLRSGWNHLGTVRSALGAEQSTRREMESGFAHAREEIERLKTDLAHGERHHLSEIREWEDRYETLRAEKLTLSSEDADLRKIREEILAANSKKRALEDEMGSLGEGLKDFQTRQNELRLQRETLLAEREELKAALNAARAEFGILQKRCSDSKDEEIKQAETIVAAERRIQSLRKLEVEMESAVERRRQQHLLNRGEVFSEAVDVLAGNSEFSQEDFYRKLIAKLDLIDDLAKRYDNKWLYPKVSEQLGILKRGFIDFLHDHSVRQFDLEPGTVLSLAERKRIKLVPLQNGAPRKTNGNENGSGPHSSRVVETLRPGYIYQNGSKDVIIRKAEVLVS